MPSKYSRLSCAGRQPRPRSDGSNVPMIPHSSSVSPIRSPNATSKRQPWINARSCCQPLSTKPSQASRQGGRRKGFRFMVNGIWARRRSRSFSFASRSSERYGSVNSRSHAARLLYRFCWNPRRNIAKCRRFKMKTAHDLSRQVGHPGRLERFFGETSGLSRSAKWKVARCRSGYCNIGTRPWDDWCAQ